MPIGCACVVYRLLVCSMRCACVPYYPVLVSSWLMDGDYLLYRLCLYAIGVVNVCRMRSLRECIDYRGYTSFVSELPLLHITAGTITSAPLSQESINDNRIHTVCTLSLIHI